MPGVASSGSNLYRAKPRESVRTGPSFVVETLTVFLHVPYLAVPATDSVPQPEASVLGQRLLDLLPDPAPILLHDKVSEPHIAAHEEILRWVAGQL